MKSVFILAADDIPTFFPQVLINAGPAVTGVLLIALAGVFAVISGIARKSVTKIAPANTPINSNHFLHRKPPKQKREVLELAEVTALSFIIVLLVGSMIVSALFVLLVLGWTVGSLIILSVRIHRSVRRPPYATGAAEFSARFSKWTTTSALWSTVAAAIITLLISPPALGLTGILLAAVLLARFQQTLAKLAHLVYEGRARATHANDPLLSTKPASSVAHPAEFFATVAGRRTLNHVFEELHLDAQTWRLIGQPTNTQMSLVAQGTEAKIWKILRIFGHGRADLMEKELLIRSESDELFPATWKVASQTIWGIPTILLSGETIDPSLILTTPTQDKVFDYQISWEFGSLASRRLTLSADSVDAERLAQSIRSGLHVTSNLPGPHQEAATTLLTQIEPLLHMLHQSPLVLSTGGAMSRLNVVQYKPGMFSALDVSTWKRLPLGWSWPENDQFLDKVNQRASSGSPPPTVIELATITSKLATLSRALNQKNLPKITDIAKQLAREIPDDAHQY